MDFQGDIYDCGWSGLPSNLKTKTALCRMGLIPNGEVVAKIRFGSQFYNLYDVSETDQLEAKKLDKKAKQKLKWENAVLDWKENKDKFAILDTETTGISRTDEIIQLSVVDLEGNVLIDEYFNPIQNISPFALKVHKLSKSFLKDYPRWTEKWSDFSDILRGRTLLIHNENFDKRMIEQTCCSHGVNVDFELKTMCTMAYSRDMYGVQKLEGVLKKLGIPHNSSHLHNAIVDCFACLSFINPDAEVFESRRLAKKYFDYVCEYKEHKFGKPAQKDGLKWLETELQVNSKFNDFEFFDLKLCNEIIARLEPFFKK